MVQRGRRQCPPGTTTGVITGVIARLHSGYNATVIEVEDRAEIDLVYFNSLISFQLCYVGQPFLVWLIRMKFAVKIILCNILRIFSLSCAAVVIVLDGNLFHCETDYGLSFSSSAGISRPP